ncbi:MAG: hypothetical protein HKN82_08855 [Akkermansiaceae bacterium]|nr:hypothetical protein [Akkermansiaceae bacterium]NNM27926.1 hypothetical protein [Akkermansiaceae bacterium]
MRNGLLALLAAAAAALSPAGASAAEVLTLAWEKNMLTIRGAHLPGGELQVHYLEAYCRAASHAADWRTHTVVGHETRLVSRNEAGTELRLRCTVKDGLVVDHHITAARDEVDFRISAHNPTGARSEAHWAQPCIRVGRFAGAGPDVTGDKYAYLRKCFVFLDGKLAMMPTPRWATEARYVPGQVWAAPGVPRADVNPRPLHPDVPSHGLIGCFSGDGSMIFATAFDPYQELFQGVIRCLHSDFRLGGVAAGGTQVVRGKIYLVRNDVPALLRRYKKDFPGHGPLHRGPGGGDPGR